MKLESIAVSNFKGLKSAYFEPKQFGCLIGENNAGKSTILQAIVYALDRSTSIPLVAFYDPTAPVVFTLWFSGITSAHLRRLTEEQQEKLRDYVVNERFCLVVRCPPGDKLETKLLIKVGREERFKPDHIADVFAGKRAAALREALVENYPELRGEAPSVNTIAAAKALVEQHVRALPPEQLEDAECVLPTGISASITALLPEAIYIPAVKNLNDEMKTTQRTSFGRLLGLLLNGMTPDLGQVNDALSTLNEMFNRGADGAEDKRHAKVKEMESLVEKLLQENFPRVSVELRVPPPELKAILNSAQIFVDDGSKDLIDNKGDGIKRSLTFCLLQAYVEHAGRRDAPEAADAPAPRPLLFLFEEPELYLHPKSQRVLFDTLRRIADAHQVVVTTHSPLFFAPGITASFVRVAKQDTQPKPVGVLHPVDIDLGKPQAETFRMARFENADAAFFSQRVVLFEGESDDAYCRHIAPLLNPDWNFDKKNVAMVRVSGKGNFKKYREFFDAFGVEVKIVADLDAMFEGYEHLGGDAVAQQLRAIALQAIDARIQALGVEAHPEAGQIKDRTGRQTWVQQWAEAKALVRQLQQNNAAPSAEQCAALDQLFACEQEMNRLTVCREDAASQQALLPVLDALRAQGICVLSRGPIEAYYPDGAPGGPKPDRALRATRRVNSRPEALALSVPLQPTRATELEEVFTELFRGL